MATQIEITFASEAHWLLETTDNCDNVGPCCFSCPMYDGCPQHYDEDEA